MMSKCIGPRPVLVPEWKRDIESNRIDANVLQLAVVAAGMTYAEKVVVHVHLAGLVGVGKHDVRNNILIDVVGRFIAIQRHDTVERDTFSIGRDDEAIRANR